MKPALFQFLWILLWGIFLFAWTDTTLDPVLMPRLLLGGMGLTMGFLLFSREEIKFCLNSIISFQPGRFIAIYLLISIACIGLAGNTAEAMADVSRTGFLLLAYFFILVVKRQNEAFFFKSLEYIWLIAAWILMGSGCMQMLSLFQAGRFTHEGLYEISLTFANRNILAEMLLLGLPWIFQGAHTQSKSVYKIFWWLSGLLCLAFTMLLLSRAVWLAAFMGGMTVLIFSLRNTYNPKLIWKYASVFILAGVFGLLLFAGFSSAENLSKLISQSWWTGIGSGSERLSLWHRTLQLVGDHPFGTGPGSWQFRWGDYSVMGTRNELGEVFFTRPHNDWLWVLAETGWLGLLAYVGIFYAAIKNSISQKPNSLPVLFGLTAYVIIAFFAFPRERIEETWMLALLFALAGNHSSQSDLPDAYSPAAKMVLITMGIFIVLLAAHRIRGEAYTRKVWEAKLQGDWKGMIHFSEAAQSWAYNTDPSSTPLSWYQGTAWFMSGFPRKACEYYQEAYRIHPTHLHVLNNLGSCEEIQNNSEAAKNYYLQALKISPIFDEARMNLAALYYNTEDLDSALYYIESCKQDWTDSVWINYRDAIYHARYVKENPDYELKNED